MYPQQRQWSEAATLHSNILIQAPLHHLQSASVAAGNRASLLCTGRLIPAHNCLPCIPGSTAQQVSAHTPGQMRPHLVVAGQVGAVLSREHREGVVHGAQVALVPLREQALYRAACVGMVAAVQAACRPGALGCSRQGLQLHCSTRRCCSEAASMRRDWSRDAGLARGCYCQGFQLHCSSRRLFKRRYLRLSNLLCLGCSRQGSQLHCNSKMGQQGLARGVVQHAGELIR